MVSLLYIESVSYTHLQENKIPYVDYYSEMVEGDNKALNSSYTRDGVHPTLEVVWHVPIGLNPNLRVQQLLK